jgi:hypothetical protein
MWTRLIPLKERGIWMGRKLIANEMNLQHK